MALTKNMNSGGSSSGSGSNSLVDGGDAAGIALFLFSGSYTIPSVNCGGSIEIDLDCPAEGNSLSGKVKRFGCVPLEAAVTVEQSNVTGSVSNKVVALTDTSGAVYNFNYTDTSGTKALIGTIVVSGVTANVNLTQQTPQTR